MAQITWRNVANTVTGNPAAALSAASSAFANVGARSDKMLQAAIARDELAQKNLTDDATQRIFGVGELAGVDKGADFGAVLADYRTGKTSAANIAQSEAAARFNEARAETEEFASTVGERERLAQIQTDEATYRTNMLESQTNRNNMAKQRLDMDVDKWNTTVAQAKTVSEGRAQAQLLTSKYNDEGTTDIDAFIEDSYNAWVERNPEATPEQQSAKRQSFADRRQDWINDYVLDRIPDAYAQLIRDSKGKLTIADFVGTDIGIAMSDAKQITRANQEKLYDAADKRRTRASNVAKSTAKLWNMGQDTAGNWSLMSADDAAGNQLRSSDVDSTLNSIFRNRDIQPSNMDDSNAKEILAKLGGNKQAFKSIFQSKEVADTGFLGDEVSWNIASDLADGYVIAMRGAASAESKVASGSTYVSREEFTRRESSEEADSLFLDAESSAVPVDATDQVVKALQTEGKEIKLSAPDVLADLAAISDNTKKRFIPEVQAIEIALGKLGIGPRATKKPKGDLQSARDALNTAQESLAFLQEQNTKLDFDRKTRSAEEEAFTAIFE